jgi:hypothetical protein
MKLPGTSVTISGGSLAIGAATVLVGPIVFGLATGVLKGILKSGIKVGMVTYEKGKELGSDTIDSIGNIVKEAKSEVDAELKAKR